MKSFMIVLLFISIFQIAKAAIDQDLIKNLPQYSDLYKGKMYSGYLSVEGSDTKQIHYMFVESQNDPSNDPVVLWLNGGPGCSSMFGFIMEHGPVVFAENTLNTMIINEGSWSKISNMLFLDSPAGVGFSKAADLDFYTNDDQTSIDSLSALKSFFKGFPEYKKNKFYISGESYAGVYIPLLANLVLDYNLSTDSDNIINLKGLLVGNGVTDTEIDGDSWYDFAYGHYLYSQDQRDTYIKECGTEKPLKRDNPKCADILKELDAVADEVNVYHIYKICYHQTKSLETRRRNSSKRKTRFTKSYLHMLDESYKIQSIREANDDPDPDAFPPCADAKSFYTYLNREDVKKALNVDTSITFNLCTGKFDETYMAQDKASIYLYPKLISSGLKIWHYSGDADGSVPFVGTREWMYKLNLPVRKPFRDWTAKENDMSGFIEDYEGISLVTFKGSGHMVPLWNRIEAFRMACAFLKDKNIEENCS